MSRYTDNLEPVCQLIKEILDVNFKNCNFLVNQEFIIFFNKNCFLNLKKCFETRYCFHIQYIRRFTFWIEYSPRWLNKIFEWINKINIFKKVYIFFTKMLCLTQWNISIRKLHYFKIESILLNQNILPSNLWFNDISIYIY